MVITKRSRRYAGQLECLVECLVLALVISGQIYFHCCSAATEIDGVILPRATSDGILASAHHLPLRRDAVLTQWTSCWQTLPWTERASTDLRQSRLEADGQGGDLVGQHSSRGYHSSSSSSSQKQQRPPSAPDAFRESSPPLPSLRTPNTAVAPPPIVWARPCPASGVGSARSTGRRGGVAEAKSNAVQSRVSILSAGVEVRPRLRWGGCGERRRTSREARAPRRRSREPDAVGNPSDFLLRIWRGLMVLEGWCEASWGGRACAHVVAGALSSSNSLSASVVVGLTVWVSCAKRLGGVWDKDGWKQVARITAEVAVLWYCHALPHGLGAGRPLRGNFGSGKAGDLIGAMWHFLGQGAFVRLVAASGRVVGVNVLEANGLLLAMSCLGNEVAGSRMRRVIEDGASEVFVYQLRGFFSRTKGMFGEKLILSLPFDVADTFLVLQGILTATEREVVKKDGALASAFREFASQPGNTLDAHSLGALGARNLMSMGFIRARVRMFGRPAISLGWTEKANNMCMVGDPICGSLLQKILDPTCVILKGNGHFYDAYVACVGCLTKTSK